MTGLLKFLIAALLIAAAPASAAMITVTPDDCSAITAHAADQDVAYQPGVDVDGNAVVSADLYDPGRIDYNVDDISITIGNPLIATAGVVGDQTAFVAAGGQINTFGADSNVGAVTLSGNEVFFNGQQITNSEARTRAVACAEAQLSD